MSRNRPDEPAADASSGRKRLFYDRQQAYAAPSNIEVTDPSSNTS